MKEWRKRNSGNNIKEIVDYNTGGKAKEFLNPVFNYYIPNLYTFASWLLYYKLCGSRITIVGDYDVDGVCASAEMHLLLKELGFRDIVVRLPRRKSEGYGLSEKIIDEIPYGVIITVDNGIKAYKQIEKAKQKGLVVMVMDHHQPEYQNGEILLPPADLIVDPHIPKELILQEYPPKECMEYKNYCAAGLVCRLANILNCNIYTYNKIAAMAAIATVADVVELTGDNRNIYHYGRIQIENKNITTGLNTIVKQLKTDNIITEDHIGFQIAPLLNAPGRIRDNGATLSYKLLMCNDFDAASNALSYVNALNEERKMKKKKAYERAMRLIQEKHMEDDNPIIIVDEKIEEGIVGLVASEICEQFETTALVFTVKDDCYKGSARAHESTSIIHALNAVFEKKPEYFLGYGGHKGAAGVTIKKEFMDGFKKSIMAEMGPRPEKKTSLEYDLEINVSQIPQMLEEIKKYAPYGNGNKPVTFLIKGFRVSPENGYFTSIGENGIKLHGNNCSAVSFSMRERYIEDGMPGVIDIVGYLEENRYMKYVKNQIQMIDYRISQAEEKNSLMDKIEEALGNL